MNDQELLEMAARAAGMPVLPQPWPDEDGWFFCLHHEKPAMHFRKFGKLHAYSEPWMPLTDDGDALRLAVALEMSIDLSGDIAEASCCMGKGANEPFYDRSASKSEAARRAIVRAAAAIASPAERT